ncbi:MAG TPA: FtsX-like permease family protein [Candidatus Bacteroides pullicola]|uniref:FtsX-like permease family protein n=1 Tax=Candidatus Bacteroides pullicola TaxID=2838475 RepID=A0A9D1ZGI8_9BACE|nr:FtsX-like permease family protein [Candidatus Bacteroides pullicola]
MIRLILHTLWARRRRNGWLLAELILVTVISWAIFDPVIVSLHDRRLPLGYDAERMALVSFGELPPEAPGYDAAAWDSAGRMRTLESIMLRVRQHPDVALATPLMGVGFPGGSGSLKTSLSLPKDTLNTMWNVLEYTAGQQFFETFGFRPAPGRTLQELSDFLCRDLGHYIMTEDLLQVGWGDTDPRSKYLPLVSNGDTNYIEIPGAIGPIKRRLDEKPSPYLIKNIDPTQVAASVSARMKVALRLKDGVSMDRFLHDFQPWMLQNLRVGNLYANKVECYLTMLQDQAYATSTALFRRSLALSVFFLVNLCLGVAGTFWVQTRTRREEVGVHLSFGATPRRIRTMLLAEGAVLVTVAVAVGCLIYWNYAMMDGLAAGTTTDRYVGLYWTDDFALHFTVISLAVYAVLLVVTLFGVWMPARSISRVPPTEALRDE